MKASRFLAFLLCAVLLCSLFTAGALASEDPAAEAGPASGEMDGAAPEGADLDEPVPDDTSPADEPDSEPAMTDGDPAIRPVDPVVDPAIRPVDPVVDPAIRPVDPVVDPAIRPVDPVVDPAIRPVDPVVASAAAPQVSWGIHGDDASYALSPQSWMLEGGGFNYVPLGLSTLSLKYYQGRVVSGLRLSVLGGTLKDGQGHEIPFLVDDFSQQSPGNEEAFLQIFSSSAQTGAVIPVYVYIDPEALAQAAPGNYTGELPVVGTWLDGGDPIPVPDTKVIRLGLRVTEVVSSLPSAGLEEHEHIADCSAPHVCLICGETFPEELKIISHAVESVVEGDYHQLRCACGEMAMEPEAHWVDCRSPGVCAGCGTACDLEPIHEVVLTGSDAEADHYSCACGEDRFDEPHADFCSDPGVCYNCWLSEEDGIVISEHQHEYTDQAVYIDEDCHRYVCFCGEQGMSAPHMITCADETKTCPECGHYAPDAAVMHNYMLRSDADGCFYACTECGDILVRLDHYTECIDPDAETCAFCGFPLAEASSYKKGLHFGAWDNVYEEDGVLYHEKYCTACGTWELEKHAVELVPAEADDEFHALVCADDGYIVEVWEHEWTEGDGGREVCAVCGAVRGEPGAADEPEPIDEPEPTAKSEPTGKPEPTAKSEPTGKLAPTASPKSSAQPSGSPKTGDSTPVVQWTLTLLLCAAGLIALPLARKKTGH